MPVGHIIRWLIALPLGLLGFWIMFANFATVFLWIVRREHHSMTPLLGGFLAMFGMLACPLPSIEKGAFVPMAIDVAWLTLTLTVGVIGLLTTAVLRSFKKPTSTPAPPPTEV